MASVLVLFRVYPEDDAVDKAMSNIKAKLNPTQMEIEDVAFGIKLIKVLFKFDDATGSSSSLEESLRQIEGVKEVEVTEETLL